MMKRLLCLFLSLFLALSVVSCAEVSDGPSFSKDERPRLYDFVGVWTNDEESVYYRFTPSSLWYCYNEVGEVVSNGEVEFDGKTFTLVAQDGEISKLSVDGNKIKKNKDASFHRTDSPSSLISTANYTPYFTNWYEESDLLGNVLTITEPDVWEIKNRDGEVIQSGTFFAYEDEPESLYLYQQEETVFYACLTPFENDLLMKKTSGSVSVETVFSLEENSTERYFYFKEKNVSCDYLVDSGTRLLRNGGAAYNDEHDYKKMPVTCRIETVSDELDEEGLRHLSVSVVYEFKRTDLPYLSGGVFYNSVLFSQYDYYTGQVFNLEDSTGNENIVSQWETAHDGINYSISCEFASAWEYFQSDEILARFVGTYTLAMPSDYDGFVICLRPVYNSYSAQVASPSAPAEGTLMIEDVGSDVEKSIFCRIPQYTTERIASVEQ